MPTDAHAHAPTRRAVVMLVISTPAHPDATFASVIAGLRWDAEVAGDRARALELLAQDGWTLHQPVVMADMNVCPGDPDDYQDIVIYADKMTASWEAAAASTLAAGCTEGLNFSVGWPWDGTRSEFGHPTCAEWG